jgi:hypothetical protein
METNVTKSDARRRASPVGGVTRLHIARWDAVVVPGLSRRRDTMSAESTRETMNAYL